MRSGFNQTVALPRPIPVIVFYTTALADSEGRVVFLADIYGQDRKLQEALRRRSRGTP
jgi:murein L,D-transpeptidase YcbB/YkuD